MSNPQSRYAVVGLGRFGIRLARHLADAGAEVIAVDQDAGLVEEIRDHVTLAVVLDATDEAALVAQGLDKVDAAIVGIGANFEAACLATSILKRLGVPRVISRATNRARGEILSRIGADEVINPEAEAAERWAERLAMPHIIEKIDLGQSHSLVQIRSPDSWAGRTLEQLNVRKKHKVNVVAIRRLLIDRAGMYIIDMPMPDSRIEMGDLLFVVGANEDIANLPTE